MQITSPLATIALGCIESPKNKNFSPFSAGEGQGTPYTQDSVKAAVVSFTHPSVESGASLDHGMLHTSKVPGHRVIHKLLMGYREQAAAPHGACPTRIS